MEFSAIHGTASNEDFMAQFTPDQLDAMRAQELQYRALANGGLAGHTRATSNLSSR